ncbi:MAG: BAX inhibitor protein [Coxiella sp. (in: Bacteria)]|nr:MAG: BAX inhibitor protein [Coxiella sp. (in: g-proteobacteria)]
MRPTGFSLTQPVTNSIEINRVLRNTYFLLSLTLLFSAGCAWYAMASNAAPLGIFILLIGMFGLYFLTIATRNSSWGLLSIMAYTGFMGYSIGPMLNFYIKTFSNGPQLIITALGATAVIFVGLSAYTLVSRKNFSYLGGAIAIGALLAFLVGIGAMLFHLPGLQLVVSGAFALISAGYILFTTSAIINGGERNYIMATIMLYVAIFNLFVSLLNILGALSGNRN